MDSAQGRGLSSTLEDFNQVKKKLSEIKPPLNAPKTNVMTQSARSPTQSLPKNRVTPPFSL